MWLHIFIAYWVIMLIAMVVYARNKLFDILKDFGDFSSPLESIAFYLVIIPILVILICLLSLVFPIILGINLFSKNKKKGYEGNETEENMPHYCFYMEHKKNYVPDKWQVFFISAVDDEKMINFFEQHHEEIQKIFETEYVPDYTEGKPLSFVYLPKSIDEQYVREVISYCRPDLKNVDLSCLEHDFVGKIYHSFIENMYGVPMSINLAGPCRTDLKNADGMDISQGFIHYKSTEYHENTKTTDDTYSFFPLHYESDEQMFQTIREYVRSIGVSAVLYKRRNTPAQIDDLGEKEQEIAKEILDRLEKLRCMGLNNLILNQILFPEIQLSHLKITANYQIYLSDYGDYEIKMPTLSKTLYFLYLRHPEGIPFKRLSEYKKELYDIYNRITTRSDTEAMQGSIDKLVDATENSVNEKCSRIRMAFVQHIDETIAKHYYITTKEGTLTLNKLICLDRNLVVDEAGILG